MKSKFIKIKSLPDVFGYTLEEPFVYVNLDKIIAYRKPYLFLEGIKTPVWVGIQDRELLESYLAPRILESEEV